MDHGRSSREAKVVSATLDGLDAVLCQRGLEKDDVLAFCEANVLEIRDLVIAQTQSLEVGGGKLGEALTVEGLFEILQSQGTARAC